jgi:protein tyrosine phosphatase (PTP) superfamily phosphohydrolase (DUF442 family)
MVRGLIRKWGSVPIGGEVQVSVIEATPARRATKFVAMTAALGLLAWFIVANIGGWKDRFFPRRFREIDPGMVYASGQINQHLIRDVLVDHKIKSVICLDPDDLSDPDVAAEVQICRELGIDRYVFPLRGDGTGDIHEYADAVAQLVADTKDGKPVLLHCSSGAQRSNGATFYYRVLVQGRSTQDAMEEMFRNGHDPRENTMLIPYLNDHMAEMANLLMQKGVIASVPSPLPRIEYP